MAGAEAPRLAEDARRERNWKLLLETLTTAKGAIKVYWEVASE